MRILLITALLLSSALCTSAQTRKKKATRNTTPAVSAQEAKANALFEEMLPSTQQLFIVDSTVVDRSELFSAIPLSASQGQYAAYSELFGASTDSVSHVFVNGFGNRCYYATNDTTGRSRFFTRAKLADGWSQPKEVTTLGDGLRHIDYPFMSADGTKLYFSAKSDEGLGGRDIYVTTYDPSDDEFLQADNLGLPFNSTADDLLYVEDDTEGFGWLVSSRRQPDGMVCVYTFVPADVRQNYDLSTYGTARLKSLAQIQRIRDTWSTPELRDEAMVKLKAYKLRQNKTVDAATQAIRFVVDDHHTYTSLDDFLSPADRQLYLNLQDKLERLTESTAQLERLRQDYHAAGRTQQRNLTPSLLNAERDVEQLQDKVRTMEKQLRNNEILLRNK